MYSEKSNIAIFFPHAISDRQSSALARLEMFDYLPLQYDIYHFEKSVGKRQFSVGPYYPQGHPKNLLSLWRLVRQFRKQYRKKPYELIWVTLPPLPMALFAAVCKKLFRIPLIVDVRDPAIASVVLVKGKNGFIYKLAWRLERWVYKKADVICVTTPELNAFLQREFGISKEAVVISNASNFKQNRKTPLKEPVKVFFAGTFAPYQLMDEVAAQVAKYKTEREGFVFECYGFKPEKHPTLAAFVKKNEIEPYFKLHPPINRDKVFEEMSKAHIVLVPIAGLEHPELYEYAIPLKMYEALAWSKPVLLFGGTLAAENLINNDKFGLICKQNENLYEGLSKIVQKYEEYQENALKAVYLREGEARKLGKVMQQFL